MRVLVIGSGGREHALAWKLRQSPLVEEVLLAPGNGGSAADGLENVPLSPDDIDGLVKLAKERGVDLVVPGPELPLTLGIADTLKEAGIPCFGPDAFCAQLEGSKSFAKEMMRRTGVPTADSRVFDSADQAREYVLSLPDGPLVVKADGLAQGKGVIVAGNRAEALRAIEAIMDSASFGKAGAKVVIENFLSGEEVSLLCLCDGENILPLPSAQDHKAALDGDAGPNTGGMGAYSPAPLLPDGELARMAALTVRPIIDEMRRLGHPFVGVLYAGLMLGPDGPRVLEYNVRFGDPECQPLLMRLEGDLAALLLSCARGSMDAGQIAFSGKSALGVVLAASGYPGAYERNLPVSGIENAEKEGSVKIFHSGTRAEDGKIFSSGGRVLCVTALGDDLQSARDQAYAALSRISMPGSRFRSDIGAKGIARLAGKE